MEGERSRWWKRTTQNVAFDILHVALPFLAVFAVPEFHFEHFAGHRLGFLLGVIFADGGEDQEAFSDRRNKLAVYCD